MIELDDYRPALDYDARWICILCGDLALLNESGVCRHCQPERVLTLAELAARVMTGRIVVTKPRWRIG